MSRDVATRMSHAGCKAQGHQIRAHDHHGRNLCRRAVSGENPCSCSCHENVDIEGDQFGCQRGQPVVVAVGVAIFDMNVLALKPTEIAKPREESFYLQISRRGKEEADAGDSLRLLRSCRQRPRQCPTSQSNEFASFHCHPQSHALGWRVGNFRHGSKRADDRVGQTGRTQGEHNESASRWIATQMHRGRVGCHVPARDAIPGRLLP